MSSFQEYFSDVHKYHDGYGYATDSTNEREAIDKIVEYNKVYNASDSQINRLKREIRENLRECWVRFQGCQDDDGQFINRWVITSEWMGGIPRWKKVFESDYNSHYVKHGHRFEPKADEPGNRVHYGYDSCDVCNQLDFLKLRIKDAAGYGQHACYCPRSVDNGCKCALKDSEI